MRSEVSAVMECETRLACDLSLEHLSGRFGPRIRILIYLLYISMDRPKQITAASIDHDNQQNPQEIFHLETES